MTSTKKSSKLPLTPPPNSESVKFKKREKPAAQSEPSGEEYVVMEEDTVHVYEIFPEEPPHPTKQDSTCSQAASKLPYVPRMPESPPVVSQPTTTSITQATVSHTSTNIPSYAFVFSIFTIIIFSTLLFWLPGVFCLLPAIGFAIAGIIKKEKQKIGEARKYGVISLLLLLFFYITYPFLVAIVVLVCLIGFRSIDFIISGFN